MAVAYVGAGAYSYNSGSATITPDIDAVGASTDDFLCGPTIYLNTGGATITSTGWTPSAQAQETAPVPDANLRYLWKIHDGSETDPTFTRSTSANSMGACLLAWSGVDTGTSHDVSAVASNGSASTFTPTGLTTTTDGAVVLAIVGCYTASNITMTTAQGFTARVEGASYADGAAVAVAVADITKSTAGSVTMPTYSCGGSPLGWVGFAVALRPASSYVTPVSAVLL